MNLTKVETVTTIVIEANIINNMKVWVVDTSATRYIYSDKSAFASYTPTNNEDVGYMRDLMPLPVDGKGKVLLKLTSRKVLTLNDVLYEGHLPESRVRKPTKKNGNESNVWV